MTAFAIDPQSMLGSVNQSSSGNDKSLTIIIGLPSVQSVTPNFVIGVTTEEQARTSSTLPGFQISAGDLFLKSARNPGIFTFEMAISESPNINNAKLRQIAQVLQQISTIASSFAFYGGVFPNIPQITSNFAIGQLNALQAMKDGFQPVLALNLYMPLNTFSTTNPFLTSLWYIDSLDFRKQEGDRGVVAQVTLKELLQKRSVILTVLNVVTNLANALLAPKNTTIAGVL